MTMHRPEFSYAFTHTKRTKSDSCSTRISERILSTLDSAVVAQWRNEIEPYQPLFLEHGLVILPDGAWMTGELHSVRLLRAEINGRLLQSFPSQTFNRMAWFGDDRGVLRSTDDISKMLLRLGIPVADENSVRAYYADELLSVLPCGDLRATELLRMRVLNRPFRTFPSLSYNQRHRLGNYRWVLENKSHIHGMFAHLFQPIDSAFQSPL